MSESIAPDKKVLVYEAALFGKLLNTGQFTDEKVYRIIDEISVAGNNNDPYVQLLNAVQDMLSELGITEVGLTCMADGYSPNYPGKIAVDIKGCEKIIDMEDMNNKVQLSKVVAQKLINAGVINNG